MGIERKQGAFLFRFGLFISITNSLQLFLLSLQVVLHICGEISDNPTLKEVEKYAYSWNSEKRTDSFPLRKFVVIYHPIRHGWEVDHIRILYNHKGKG